MGAFRGLATADEDDVAAGHNPMFAFFCDLAQVPRIELEGDVPGLTWSEMDALESSERAPGSAWRLRVLEVKLRDLIGTDPGRITDVRLDGERLAGLQLLG